MIRLRNIVGNESAEKNGWNLTSRQEIGCHGREKGPWSQSQDTVTVTAYQPFDKFLPPGASWTHHKIKWRAFIMRVKCASKNGSALHTKWCHLSRWQFPLMSEDGFSPSARPRAPPAAVPLRLPHVVMHSPARWQRQRLGSETRAMLRAPSCPHPQTALKSASHCLEFLQLVLLFYIYTMIFLIRGYEIVSEWYAFVFLFLFPLLPPPAT